MRKTFSREQFIAEAAAIRAERVAEDRQALLDRLRQQRDQAQAQKARLEREIEHYNRVLGRRT